jgi:hypothetical protein
VPTAHATVTTTRPSRYLSQLCRHIDHLSRHPNHRPHRQQGDAEHTPPTAQAQATWTETVGAIDLGCGRCTLTANDDALVLHTEARHDADLHRLQALLTARLEHFGRRDHLTVSWQPVPTPTPSPATDDKTGGDRRRTHRRTAALVAVGVLVVALHLGLGAAVIAARPWTGWALDIVLAAVAVKLLASIVLGRRIVDHRRRSLATARARSGHPRA